MNKDILINFGTNEKGEEVASTLQHVGNMKIVGGLGKTTLILNILNQLVKQTTNEELQMFIFDSKNGEYRSFEGDAHLIENPIIKVSDMEKAIEDVVHMIEQRTRKYHEAGVENIDEFNEKQKKEHKQTMKRIVVVFDNFDAMNLDNNDFLRDLLYILPVSVQYGVHFIIAMPDPRPCTFPLAFQTLMDTHITFQTVKFDGAYQMSIGILKPNLCYESVGEEIGDALIRFSDEEKPTFFHVPKTQNQNIDNRELFYENAELKAFLQTVMKSLDCTSNFARNIIRVNEDTKSQILEHLDEK